MNPAARRSTVLVLGALLLASFEARAQEGFGEFLSPRFGEREVEASYLVEPYLEVGVDDQGRELQMTRHGLDLSVPLHQDGTNEWILSGRGGLLDLDTDALLPDQAVRLPGELYDLRAGLAYRHRFENEWIAGGSLSLGSTSDEPFDSFEEMVVAASAFLRIPHGRNGFLFLLHFSNNRSFLPFVPLPGLGYQFGLGPNLRGVVGFPFNFVRWQPVDPLVLQASYVFPRRIQARIGLRPFDALEIHADYDWSSQRWLRADRPDDDRLTYREMRVHGGLEWSFENLRIDLVGGYAFERMLFEGEDFGDRGDDRIDLGGGPFLRFEIEIKF